MWHLTDVGVDWVDAGDRPAERWCELARGCQNAIIASEPVPEVAPETMLSEATLRARALCRAMRGAGVRRLVFRAHACALGGAPGEEVDEASYREVRAGDDPWSSAALAAEEEVYLEWGEGLEVVFVAPTVVIGPGDAGGTQAGDWLRSLARGRSRWVIDHPVDVVDARDAARAMVAAMDAGRKGRRYVVGGHATTTRDLAERVRLEAGGRETRPLELDMERWLPRLSGGLRGRIEGLTWGAWRRASASYDMSRARGELGHKPRKLEGTLREALAWYEAYGE